jgi:hypothetical protein
VFPGSNTPAYFVKPKKVLCDRSNAGYAISSQLKLKVKKEATLPWMAAEVSFPGLEATTLKKNKIETMIKLILFK